MTKPVIRILIVDDEADARELLVHGLARKGYAAEGACDGEEACALLDGTFDAVVTDLVMPRLDGLGLLKRIPELNPRAIKIVITSFADKERAIAALNLGANQLIEKPFTTQKLVDILERTLGERALDSPSEALRRRLDALPVTVRERELVLHLLKGFSNKEIARLMDVREQSVKNYLHHMYAKIGITSRSELFHMMFPL